MVYYNLRNCPMYYKRHHPSAYPMIQQSVLVASISLTGNSKTTHFQSPGDTLYTVSIENGGIVPVGWSLSVGDEDRSGLENENVYLYSPGKVTFTLSCQYSSRIPQNCNAIGKVYLISRFNLG